MGETVTNLPCLQQSVSFGRFEHDSLCWERWSTFPSNKYLEEVEKCSTPGSVAQKKAYFEAHYKKIAARRAELLVDQDSEREADELPNHEDSTVVSVVYDASEDRVDEEVGGFDGEVIVEHVSVMNDSAGGFNQENGVDSIDCEVSVEHVHVKSDTTSVFSQENDLFDLDLSGYMSENIDGSQIVNDVNEAGNLISGECEDVKVLKDDDDNVVYERSEAVSIEVTENAGEVNDGAYVAKVVNKEIIVATYEPYNGCDSINERDTRPKENEPSIDEELPQEMVKRTIAEEESKKLTTLASPKKSQKPTLLKTTSAKTAKNVPASPIRRKTSAVTLKSPMLSTPKSSKPESTKITKSGINLLDKKENGFTPCSSSKKTVGPQSKSVIPTSMHMSLSLGPINSGQTPVIRKSLIMESMGDKDIVKRAFKAFQRSPQMSSSGSTKAPASNQSVSRKAEPKCSPENNIPKKNEGIRRAAKTTSIRNVQQENATSLTPGVKVNCGTDQRNGKSLAASFGPRVQLQGNNQKEASKKLESTPKFNATQPHSKRKVEKASETKTRDQNVNSKPKHPSSNIHGYGGSVRKENGISKIQASA